MVTFRDPVHGDLVFEGVVEDIIKTPEFQRLSEVKQLGLTDKVYTGATHTRLAHSIGVCHLAGEMARRLGVPANDALLLQIAALLHDVGHYDFSHALEHIAPMHHEEQGHLIIKGEVEIPGRGRGGIASVLRAHGIDPERIVALLQRRDCPAHYASILSGKVVDADRMDYLKRDTYYTGAVIGEIDVSRLLRVLAVHPRTGELGIHEKGVATMEQFLIARAHMYQQVYLHPDSFAAEAMLRKAVEESKDIATPLLYGDGHLLARLAERGSLVTRELVRRIRAGKRALHTAALIVRTDASADLLAAVERLRAQDRADPGRVERSLCARIGAEPGLAIVTFGMPKAPDALPSFPVLRDDGTWSDLFEISALARAVMLERRPYPVLAVHADGLLLPRVRSAMSALLGVDG